MLKKRKLKKSTRGFGQIQEGLSFLAGCPGRKKVSRAQELPVRTTLSRGQPRRHRARLFALSLGFGADGQDVYERDSCCLGPPSGGGQRGREPQRQIWRAGWPFTSQLVISLSRCLMNGLCPIAHCGSAMATPHGWLA